MEHFEIEFLPEALEFLSNIPVKAREKILFNMGLAKSRKDPKLFEPLQYGVWYFRTKYFGNQYRIFAFWDKTEKTNTLVIATHGIIKKSDKPSKSEILKAKAIKDKYFESKK
ncbi:MAG: type II toxin-antitoxin system RelE/ParE family toxin [Saprospiraceae bacterium]|nr:type II toxin-antitoxin system RelE/ParE family toxin [Saprospiraceae bacterium]MBK7795910.1 type II toxin-antitoxin system RelE/ParE family toxin [Saprospiraceae bacterium]